MLGTFAAIGALYGAACAASLVSLVIPEASVALLGFIPLVLGIRQLFDRDAGELAAPHAGRHGLLAVVGVNIAMGGDNIGVYTPLFAAAPAAAIGVYGAVFTLLTGAMCYAAYRLVAHPALGAPIRRTGRRAMPYVLIVLGIWILAGL